MRRFFSILFYGFIIVVVIGIIAGRKDKSEATAADEDQRIETRAVDPFETLVLGGDFKVVIRNGDTYSVTIAAPASWFETITTQVSQGTLRVNTGRSVFKGEQVTLNIVTPSLRRIEAGGAVHLLTIDPLAGERIEVHLSGAAEADLNLDYQEVDARLSGAGHMALKGQAPKVSLQVSGAGALDAYELIAEHVTVSLSGAASAKVYADHTLQARISGAGSVRYRGEPEVVQPAISGAGSIRPE